MSPLQRPPPAPAQFGSRHALSKSRHALSKSQREGNRAKGQPQRDHPSSPSDRLAWGRPPNWPSVEPLSQPPPGQGAPPIPRSWSGPSWPWPWDRHWAVRLERDRPV